MGLCAVPTPPSTCFQTSKYHNFHSHVCALLTADFCLPTHCTALLAPAALLLTPCLPAILPACLQHVAVMQFLAFRLGEVKDDCQRLQRELATSQVRLSCVVFWVLLES